MFSQDLKAKKIFYKSYKKFYPKSDIFMKNTTDESDVKQGSIGTCYFVSSAAAVANFPDRIKDLFINKN